MGPLHHIARLYRMVRNLARYDALFFVTPFEAGRPGLRFLIRLMTLTASRAKDCPERPGARLAAALQASGPAFIKLGQTLATRPDLVGDEIAEDLSSLQDRLPPFSGEEARAALEEALGGPVSDFFSTFNDTPVAAASIAQVHYAQTTDGRDVAVKILRPGIEAGFARDLESFTWLAHLAERSLPRSRRLRPIEVVRTLARSVALEMDLRMEAAAASELAENMVGEDGYRIPVPDWNRTAKRVLTMERVRGISIGDRKALAAAGHDATGLAGRIINVFLTQSIRDGFFHADMHAGNFFVEEDGTLVAVDFGIMGRLDRRTRRVLAEILWGFHERDYFAVADAHFDAGYVPRTESRELFAQALRAIGEPIMDKPASEISFGRLMAQLLATTETFSMQTRPELLTLQRTMVMAEGLALSLDREVNFWTVSRPVLEREIQELLSPINQVQDGLAALSRLLRRLPEVLAELEEMLDRQGSGETPGRSPGAE